jgi:outer membrane protein OmpA-like peptidoglycan-associated protein
MIRSARAIPALILVSLLQACASGPPEEFDGATLEETEAALASSAANNEVTRYAPVELQKAQDRYRVANEAWAAGETLLAQHLAYLSRRHVDIARAIATEESATARARELTRSLDSLELELRNRQIAAQRSEIELQRSEIEQLRQRLSGLQPRQSAEGTVFTIGDVLFPFDSVQLLPAAAEPLDNLAEFLREHPERQVRIEGYTDDSGPAEYNRELSELRAMSVADAMADRGISFDRMTVIGYGESNPVASNATEAGRERNRRVEVVILD